MSSEWPTATLGDYVTLDTGYPFKSAEFVDAVDGVRLLRGDNLGHGSLRWDGAKGWPMDRCDGLGSFEMVENDLVLAMDRPWISSGLKFARVHSEDLPALLVQRVARLRPKDGIDNLFLHAIVASPSFTSYIQSVTTGTAVPHISAKQIRDYQFQLPPLPLQKSAGALLASLSDRITLLRESNTTLETIAQALFKSWFVDFDPVLAKSEGSIPEGMDEATAALFPDSFEESALGLVPKGWQVGGILDAATLLSGGTPKTDRPEFWGGDVLWASAKDVSQASESVLLGTGRTITPLGLNGSSTKMIPALATAIVARGATTGRMVMFGTEMAMNQTCYALTSRFGAPIALHLMLRRQVAALLNAAHGSVFDTITTSTFSQSACLVPPENVLHKFEEHARPLYDRLIANVGQIQILATLRDTLLPRLISGQLRLTVLEDVNA